jgi:hypothetical protein
MIYSNCDRCSEIVENWTLEEVYIEEKGSHFNICNDCFKELEGGNKRK